MWRRLRGCSSLDLFRSCYQYHDDAVKLDDGTIVSGTVRYYRTCGDFGSTGNTGLGNHFLGTSGAKPGHLVKPPGYAYADGSEPPGLDPCGDCPDGRQFWAACSVCASEVGRVHYRITGPDPGSEETVDCEFRCDGTPQYHAISAPVDALGFKLLGFYVDDSFGVVNVRWLAPNGVSFTVQTDDELGGCSDHQWFRLLFTPLPVLGAGWFLDFDMQFV